MIGFKIIEEFTLEDCESFLNRKDISQEERQQAERRRNYLQYLQDRNAEDLYDDVVPESGSRPVSRPKTIMEEFPEYGFVPTTILGGKKKMSVVLLLIGGIVTIVGVVLLCFGIRYNHIANSYERKADYYLEKACEYEKLGYENKAKEMDKKWQEMDDRNAEMGEHADGMLVSGTYVIFSCMAFFAVVLVGSKSRKFIMAVADYFPMKRAGFRGKWVIFVKDRKFGLLKQGRTKIVIPAQYEKLSWQQGNILMGEELGKCFLIDRKGKRLTRNYDRLSWRDGITLEAVDNGRDFLIDIYGNELS